ncbi:UNKNOWN [Stylonychia lemnae]|uniref:Uncharacterized protein n=1 Tax=Stylonychia lemnae TaxID=5949 RepID=A0A078AWQ2_STYLE|nr:UNKNOWN [Stylonychia lemnae]|eukprot:CDW86476.1 UNKNOWN [Stylonychia lemnae]
MEAMNEPLKLLQMQVDQENRKPQIQINSENLDKILNENKQAFVIGVLGRQQIGKSTFLRSSFDVNFQSSSIESQGYQTTVGQDIAVKQDDDYDLVLIDAEGFGSSECKLKYQNQITWSTSNQERRRDARNLSKFSSALQSVFLLEICDIVFVFNEYYHDWEDFEEFISCFKTFENEKRSLPEIKMIKGADIQSKQILAVTNLREALGYENNEEIDPQSFDNQNEQRINENNCFFLPNYSGDDSLYKQQNDRILSTINEIFQNKQDNLRNQIELKKQIQAITDKLNQVLRMSDLKPLSVFEFASIQFELHFQNEDFIKPYKDLVKKIQNIQSQKEFLEYQLKKLDIPSTRDILCISRFMSHTLSGMSIATSVAGMCTSGAALAGVAVVPPIGSIVFGLTASTLISKIGTEKFILNDMKKVVEREVKRVEDFMQDVKQIMEILEQIKEIIEKSSSLKRLLVFLIIKAIKNNANISYPQLQKKVIEHYVIFTASEYQEKNPGLSMLSTIISEEEFKFPESKKQYFSVLGNEFSGIRLSLLRQQQKVKYLTRNSQKIYEVTGIGSKPIRELQKIQNLGGLDIKSKGADGIRLIGKNTGDFKHIEKFNVKKVNTVVKQAKLSEVFGFALKSIGLAVEAYSIVQYEDDFNKNMKQMDKFELTIEQLKQQLPEVLEIVLNFESIALQGIDDDLFY